eukprot:TRINITY_DN1868_c0_g3_i1.p1 TRINITY_DN1868_c0_g3~~TRINITY_DN1868_c0_g3_i1.p1  ORF type:complete len:178 (+),score=97.74 TRINITY_DN1868_c0_g3_i1:171-704(+)
MGSITGDLLSKEGIFDIMDFEYLAYGNAQKEGSEIDCQHGPAECLGNMAETCVKNMTGNAPLKYIPFDVCLESGSAITNKLISKCAKKQGINEDELMSCVTGPKGKALIDIEAKKTAANFAGKSEQYVPYFTLNGKEFTEGEGPQLLKAVCDAWTGEKPAGCPSYKAAPERCYAGKN